MKTPRPTPKIATYPDLGKVVALGPAPPLPALHGPLSVCGPYRNGQHALVTTNKVRDQLQSWSIAAARRKSTSVTLLTEYVHTSIATSTPWMQW
mmetsp:Transcript_19163/g.33878  ORF Transcript_19163/g.33878 Transcript_19163/m.33878 type:complete len:94 (-) Transcript_19163:2105-2386(-)